MDSIFQSTPSLKNALELNPVQAHPHERLTDAIARIAQYQLSGYRATCLLATENQRLQGILTRRDIVRLTANQADFGCLRLQEVMVHPVKTIYLDELTDVFAPLFLFRRYRIRHLPVIDRQEQLIGLISQTSLRRLLRPINLLKMRRVADVMTQSVIHASPETSVFSISQLMADHCVSCVVIIEQDEKRRVPLGILTEGDIVQLQLQRADVSSLLAAETMSHPLLLLSPQDSLWHAHQQMARHRVRRLVVSWNWGIGLGLVTQTSLLRVFEPMEMYDVIESLQETIQQLEAEKANHWQCPDFEIPRNFGTSDHLGASDSD